MILYLNGVQAASKSSVPYALSVKSYNFMGKSNWAVDPLIDDAIFDEFKIFNRPLNSSQIISEMNKLQPQIITFN